MSGTAQRRALYRCARCLDRTLETYGGECWDCAFGSPRELPTEAVLIERLESTQARVDLLTIALRRAVLLLDRHGDDLRTENLRLREALRAVPSNSETRED